MVLIKSAGRFHFSVEYFEDLRNMNHCEFVIMKKDIETGKYMLENKLRTWSELQNENEATEKNASKDPKVTGNVPQRREWGRERPSSWLSREDQTVSTKTDDRVASVSAALRGNCNSTLKKGLNKTDDSDTLEFDTRGTSSKRVEKAKQNVQTSRIVVPSRLLAIRGGRDGGGSLSGTNSRDESSEDEASEPAESETAQTSRKIGSEKKIKTYHVRADALGDQSETDPDEDGTDNVIRDTEAKERSIGGSVY